MTNKKDVVEYDVVLSPEEQLALKIIEDLNTPQGDGLAVGLTTRLHEGQISALRELYRGKINTLFVPCGRKFGKTELAIYCLWKHALENPGSACYYIGPEAAHARKIVWDLGRIQKFLGAATAGYINSIRNQEMMVTLKNGSFIQVIGSDNYAVANGLTPSIAVYDEFKHFNHKWHTEFSPNLVVKNAPLIIIGTLPRGENKNYQQYNDMLEYSKGSDKVKVVLKTTWDNPINLRPEIKERIEQEIEQLRK